VFLAGSLSSTERIKLKEQPRQKPRAEKWAEDDRKKMEEFLEKGGISRGNNVGSHSNNSRVEPYPYLISK
jgi:hypothetical protein